MCGSTIHKEGDLYRVYQVDDLTFEIRYGYYAEDERGRVEPLPIYPDLVKKPIYTGQGIPATAYVQAPCVYYKPKWKPHQEDWCGDCLYYDGGRKKISRCLCPERRLE